MGLTPGTRFGAYEITSLLGKGGMGEVYRARDGRLGRDVALKVLPEVFAADPDRVARFEREARVLASLTHASIGAIYGLEEDVDEAGRTVRALVLELVEGETLADRLTRGRLPIDDLLPVARQITEALEAAHEQGVIHRDLKPANIKLTPNGTVKVLDFGLAKLAGASAESGPHERGSVTQPLAALSMSPTIAMPGGTAVGIILGTAAYMSPEQAKGRPADKRSDMWAFGCVLFEMLTGRPAFEGDDVSETLAEVIKSQIVWEKLPADTPPALRRLLRRCLVKDPKSRIADAGVARLEIDEAASQPETMSRSTDASSVAASSVRQRWGLFAAGLVLGAAIATSVAIVGRRNEPAGGAPTTRFGITLPASVRLVLNASQRLAISRDGRRLFYTAAAAGVERLYVQPLDRLDATAVPGIEGDLGSIFLSPDGEWIGYNDPRAGKFKKVRWTGGPPATICDVPNAAGGFTGASWGSTGTIVFSTANSSSLMQVPEAGGAIQPLTNPKGERHRQPFFLPDGQALLFTINKPSQPDQVAVLKLDTGTWKVLAQGSSPRYSPTGHVIFLRENALWAQAFNAATLEGSGDAVPVVEGVARQGAAAIFDIAANGTMVYAPISSDGGSLTAVWVDRSGHEEALGAPPHAYVDAQLSPDGGELALAARDLDSDIWIWHLARKTLTRLTFDRASDVAPFWTPDGRRIVFTSDREGGTAHVFWQLADGTGPVERLTEGTVFQLASSVSPDGRFAVLEQREGPSDLFAVSLSAPSSDQAQKPRAREIRPLVKSTFIERNGTISRDGRWFAYESNSSGEFQIFVRPYPDTDGGQWQVSTSGGTKPVWSRNSRELFFVGDGAIMRVAVGRGSTWTAGIPEVVVKGAYAFEVNHPFDVSADGERFIVLKQEGRPSQPSGPSIVLIENWTEELKRLLTSTDR